MRSILSTAAPAAATKKRTPAYLGMGIGIEEAEVMAETAVADASEISNKLVDNQRLLDLTDSLEDMAVIAEQLEGDQPTARALIETAARMAVAGTDVEPTAIVPAMESYHGRVAVEGLRAQAEAIWKKVKHSMSGIWDKLDHLFTNVVGIYFQVSRNAAIARKELNEALDPKPANDAFKVRNPYYMANAEHSYTSYADVRSALMDVHATLKWALEDYALNLISVGDSLSKNMKDFDTSKGENVFEEMELLMRKAISFPGLKKDSHLRNRQGEAYVGEALPGGVSLLASVYSAGTGLPERLAALGQHKVELAHTTLHGYVAPREVMFQTMALTEMVTLLSLVDEISETADRFCKGSFPKRLKAIRHEVDLATTSLYDVKISSEEDRAVVKTVKSLAMTFPKWVESPIAALLVYASNFCTSVIKLCEQSGEQYQSYRDQQRVKQLEIENEELQSHIDELEEEIDALKAAQAEMEQQVVVVIQMEDDDAGEVGDPSAHG